MYRVGFIGLFAALGMFVACGGAENRPGNPGGNTSNTRDTLTYDECASDAQCADKSVCVFSGLGVGNCFVDCAEDRLSCPSGMGCLPVQSGDKLCFKSCTSDSVCGGDECCQNDWCVPAEYCDSGPSEASCEGICGQQHPSGTCWCNAVCGARGDCCSDFKDLCEGFGSCEGHCGGSSPDGCWCDAECQFRGNCCPDFQTACP